MRLAVELTQAKGFTHFTERINVVNKSIQIKSYRADYKPHNAFDSGEVLNYVR